jgi:hypothetical protein
MSSRDEDFLRLYRTHRFDDQYAWYEARVDEYESAHDQVITLAAIALFGAAAAGAVASFDLFGWRVAWGVLAAVMSGVATLIGAYDQLIGYEQTTKLYRDAKAALGALRSQAPWLSSAPLPEGTAAFVDRVEAVFQSEIGQWGQLTKTEQPRT